MDAALLKKCLGGLINQVFYCGAHGSMSAPICYVRDKKARAKAIQLLKQKSFDFPALAKIRVKLTSQLRLEKTKSLEAVLKRLPHEHIIFDPTATIERAKALVVVAKSARVICGHQLKACTFNSETRHLHCLLKSAPQLTTDAVIALHQALECCLSEHCKVLSQPFFCTLSLSFSPIQSKVIAIDQDSSVGLNMTRLMKAFRQFWKWPLIVAASATGFSLTVAKADAQTVQTTAAKATTQPDQAASAQTAAQPNPAGPAKAVAVPAPLPAVAYTNGWIGASVGGLHNSNRGGAGAVVDAGVAFPLPISRCNNAFGGELHAYEGSIAHRGIFSADGYLFWRNPAQGLLGIHGIYTQTNHLYQTLYGLHGEDYFNQWTLTLEGGWVHQNLNGGSYYAEGIAHWYVQPDFKLDLGAIVIKGDAAAQVGAEYQFGMQSLPGLSLFADAGVGHRSLHYGFLGLRYYFGCDKTLIRRHREDMVLPTMDLIMFENKQHVLPPPVVS